MWQIFELKKKLREDSKLGTQLCKSKKTHPIFFFLFDILFHDLANVGVQTQNTVYEIVSEMNTRQDVMEERLSTLEEKLTLLQETLEALPEAISRYLPTVVNNAPFSGATSGWSQPPQTESNGTELQRRQQFLHPESTYGSIGGGAGGATNSAAAAAAAGNGSGGVTHSRSSPGTWTATSPAGASTSTALPVPAQPPQPPPLPSKPKLS